MLGDFGEPHLVGSRSSEVPSHHIVVERRPRDLPRALAVLLRGRRPDRVLPAETMPPPLTGSVTGSVEFVGDEPISESSVVATDVDDGVGEVRVVPVAARARSRPPLVERLTREPEHSGGYRHRDPLDRKVTDQREHHLGVCPWRSTRRPGGETRSPSPGAVSPDAAAPARSARR